MKNALLNQSVINPVLRFCCLAAPYMPFCFIFFKNNPDFISKNLIDLNQSFRNVLMYSAFTNAKFFCSISYGGFLFNNEICQINSPFFYVSLQLDIPPLIYQSQLRTINKCFTLVKQNKLLGSLYMDKPLRKCLSLITSTFLRHMQPGNKQIPCEAIILKFLKYIYVV